MPEKCPRVQVDLFITNLFIDLIADNIDVAIRFGELRDSTIIAKRIGRSVRHLVASPHYLKGRTPPAKAEDLENHQCIPLNGRNNEAQWHLVNGRKSVKLQQGTRRRSPAVELLRRGNWETHSRSHPARMVVAGYFRSCRLSDTSIYSVQTSSFPRRAESMEKLLVASPALTAIGSLRTNSAHRGDTKLLRDRRFALKLLRRDPDRRFRRRRNASSAP